MCEGLLDVKKMINPESFNPTNVARPIALSEQQVPEFRKFLNLQVLKFLWGSLISFCLK